VQAARSRTNGGSRARRTSHSSILRLGWVHVAIGKPGIVQSIHPGTGASAEVATAAGAHTTALVPPDRLYVFSPSHGGALVFQDAPLK
jgi:hypothetical protein